LTLASEATRNWGIGTVILVAVMWFVLTDVVRPLVASHTEFLGSIRETQQLLLDATLEQNDLIRRAVGGQRVADR
jgi:hypothetical protein